MLTINEIYERAATGVVQITSTTDAFSTGPTGFAVNLAGAVPIVAFADKNGIAGYKLAALVRADSPFQKLSDLKGKRVGFVVGSPALNQNSLAVLAFGGLTQADVKAYEKAHGGKGDFFGPVIAATVIADKPEKAPAMPAGGDGGMGGMDF